MPSIEHLKQWMHEHRKAVREDFFAFLRFKSISADPAFSKDLERCAEWLKNYLERHTKMVVELVPTEGAPLVYAEEMSEGKDAPTVLIYGHYDVQPVDPLELWDSDPFEPEERDGHIYARGAQDDKGQIFYAMIAMRAMRELGIGLSVNVKFCIEGEEESSSRGLSKSLPKLMKKLASDFLLVIDFGLFDKNTPAITLGARGIAAFAVILRGSKSDLHSGMHGGLAYNPNRALVEVLAQVWDANGRIQIEGFYEDIEKVDEKAFAFGYEEEAYCREFGVGRIGGERGKTMKERNGFCPTFEINGMSGGYTGRGFKTVIPAISLAKISCRLVPNQDPKKIGKALEKFFHERVAQGIVVEIKQLGGEKAFRSRPDSLLGKAVAEACREVCGKACKNIVSGGSIPIIAEMIEALGVEVIGMGYGIATDAIHAPNERFDFQRFEKGFLTVARALEMV